MNFHQHIENCFGFRHPEIKKIITDHYESAIGCLEGSLDWDSFIRHGVYKMMLAIGEMVFTLDYISRTVVPAPPNAETKVTALQCLKRVREILEENLFIDFTHRQKTQEDFLNREGA